MQSVYPYSGKLFYWHHAIFPSGDYVDLKDIDRPIHKILPVLKTISHEIRNYIKDLWMFLQHINTGLMQRQIYDVDFPYSD